ncbi:hypothetical protein D3C86_1534300 [compost metagenome]
MNKFGLMNQALKLIRVCQQRQDAVADQIHSRLVPCDNQQCDNSIQLLFSQLVAFLFGGNKLADHILSGFFPQPIEHLPQILNELLHMLLHLAGMLPIGAFD